MKLKLLIVSSVFSILSFPLFSASVRSETVQNPENQNSALLKECMKSPKNLIKEGNDYFACGSSSKISDTSLADTVAENSARAVLMKALRTQQMTFTINNSADYLKKLGSNDSPIWDLLKYIPSPAEAKNWMIS